MINCMIIDDEEAAIEILTTYVAKVSSLRLVASTTNPVEGLQMLNRLQVDLVFLDIQMPDLSGLDFMKAISGNTRVILTTAYSQYALQGYEFNVIDYLVKPIPFPRFLSAVHKAVEVLGSDKRLPTVEVPGDFIFVKTGLKGQVQRIDLAEVSYIESAKNYVTIYHGNKKTLVYVGMKDLEEQLPRPRFLRVHRSFIIPMEDVAGLEGNKITLRSAKADIVLGDAYRKDFMDFVSNKTIGK